ncbi:MAG: hypothetical protein KF788_11225 [Piscinibacter sp.]|nr:hypothetical protein [Piscinibacter sp.]
MTASRVETLVWVLIYGGLLGVALGLAVRDGAAALGWLLMVGGAIVAVAGVVLIWVRSRMKEEDSR